MKNINKKSASLVALQLSASLSPLTLLTQASADTMMIQLLRLKPQV